MVAADEPRESGRSQADVARTESTGSQDTASQDTRTEDTRTEDTRTEDTRSQYDWSEVTRSEDAQRRMGLAERILSGSLAAGRGPGSRLPTERQLAADLGVTRSLVRQALAVLEAQGRISREVGRGTFLREPPPALDGAGLRAPLADFAPADVMTIRRLLEPAAMSLVVAWATAADLEEMDRCVAGGDAAASYEQFESCDLALHRTIMAASHSPLLVALYREIEAARHGHVWGDLKRRSSSREHRQQYQADHRAIVGALHSRDAARAVDAMRLHLARVSDHLNATDPAAVVTWR